MIRHHFSSSCSLAIISRFGLVIAAVFIVALPIEAQSPWQITLEATHPALLDRAELVIAAATGALSGYDYYDALNPPSFPDRSVDLYCLHSNTEEGWKKQPGSELKYSALYVSPLMPQDATIEFTLKTDLAGQVTLSWAPVNDPALENYDVTLHDWMGGVIDMKTESEDSCFFFLPGTRDFEIEIASRQEPVPPKGFLQTY